MAATVIGVPLYENTDHLEEALESLLGQTDRDCVLVVCDDSRSDEPGRIVRRYAEADNRVHYLRNDCRLGMTANWRRTFAVGKDLHPSMRYFAWASDHDVWHPRWLEALRAELEAHPEANTAYPLSIRVSGNGEPVATAWTFDTAGFTDVRERLSAAATGMFAGDMVYGLFRAEALERAGVFSTVLLPDRLLLSQLAVHGEFRQVRQILWYRRFTGAASLARQRAAFWPEGAPAHGYLPWWLVHPVVLANDLVVRGQGKPTLGRRASVRLVMSFVLIDIRFELLRKVQRTHARLRKRLSLPARLLDLAVAAAARRGLPGIGLGARVRATSRGVVWRVLGRSE